MDAEAGRRVIIRCVVCHARIGYDTDDEDDTDVCDDCGDFNWHH